MEIRLNKFLSDSGVCSRREADKAIDTGKVTINKRRAQVGDKVRPNDQVRYNGNLIEHQTQYVYLALNKPVGITSTSDTPDKTNVINFINYPVRIFHVGRLDKDSEGLLLLTNDGDIVNKILRAGNNHEKEYEVWVDKAVDQKFLETMRSGVKILGTVTKKCQVEMVTPQMFRITLTQGLNRQIRRMCEALGYEVVRLRRVRVMNIELGTMQVGEWRILEGKELDTLLDTLRDSEGREEASRGAGAKKKSNGWYKKNLELNQERSQAKEKPKSHGARDQKRPKSASQGAKSTNTKSPKARVDSAKPKTAAKSTAPKSRATAPKAKSAAKPLSKFNAYRRNK
ncbi:MAG: 23S rRNA pseudouridine(2604) synthase RluF [Rikenellaceae bacterium]